MPINGNINISCNDEPVLTLCTVYDNNTPINLSSTESMASLEMIHDTKSTAHQALFNEIRTKNTAQDLLIAQKANSSDIPTKLSQLTNDVNYITDTSDKANVSLSNITSEAITRIQSYIPQSSSQAAFCINNGYKENGLNKTLSYNNAILTCASCTITNANNETKTFSTSATLDCSSYANGTYYILKNYVNGNLELNNDIYLGKNADKSWTQPILSANGTLGGSSFACAASLEGTTYYAWKVFDGSTVATDSWYSSAVPSWLTFYNPTPLKVTSLAITNYTKTAESIITAGTVSASNDNTNWTQLKSFTNSNLSAGGTWQIDLSNNSDAYQYYRITATAINKVGVLIQELGITATYAYFSKLYKENNSIIYKELSESTYSDANKVIIGTVKINNGLISSLYNNEFNKNILDEIASLPDYERKISITSNSKYTAENNGWIYTSSGIVKSILSTETFTPTSSGYYFCPMKGTQNVL